MKNRLLATMAVMAAISPSTNLWAQEMTGMDMTDKIQDPSFETRSLDGSAWTSVGFVVGPDWGNYSSDKGGQVKNFLERFQWQANIDADARVEQTITGLPSGKYRVYADVGAFNQNDASVAPVGAYLFAIADDGEEAKTAVTQAAGSNGNCTNVSVDAIVLGGKLTIGYRYEVANGNCNWCVCDNFKLEYLGGGSDLPIPDQLKAKIDEAVNLKADIAFDVFSNAGGKAFYASIDAAQLVKDNADATEEEQTAALRDLTKAVLDINADIDAYVQLDSILGSWYDEETDPYLPKMKALMAYRDELSRQYDERTFDPNEIKTVEEQYKILYREGLKDLYITGVLTDATRFIVNPNFETINPDTQERTSTANGWSGSMPNWGLETENKQGVPEFWSGDGKNTYDTYQEITGLASGTYEVQANAVYRPCDNNTWFAEFTTPEHDAQADVLPVVYANESSRKFFHIGYLMTDETYGVNDEGNPTDITFTMPAAEGETGATKYAPNAPSGANARFQLEPSMCVVKVKCFVGEDGKLRFGVRKTDTTGRGDSWSLFDNFKITYLGHDNYSGLAEAIQNRLDNLNTLLESDEALTNTQAALQGLKDVQTEGEKVLAEPLTKETSDALIAKLDQAIATFNSDHAAAIALQEYAFAQNDSLESYAAQYGSDKIAGIKTAVQNVLDALDQATLKDAAHIAALTDGIDFAYSDLMSNKVDYSTASKDTPLDVTTLIANPSFEKPDPANEGSFLSTNEGWTMGVSGVNGSCNYQEQEFWSTTNGANIQQKVLGLRPGYYVLKAQGFYRAGSNSTVATEYIAGTEDLRGKLYVTTGERRWEKTLVSVMTGISDLPTDDTDAKLPEEVAQALGLDSALVINMMVGARKAFDAGRYENELYFYLHEGEKVVIGVDKDGGKSDDWLIFDNFRLTYFGDGEANMPTAVTDVEAKAEVVATKYFNAAGQQVDGQAKGFVIRVDKLANGATRASKSINK